MIKNQESRIKDQIQSYWGKGWLQKQGLQLKVKNNWLIAMFRKHRRPFNYLQHFIVCMALDSTFYNLNDLFDKVSLCPPVNKQNSSYSSISTQVDIDHHQSLWLELLHQNPAASLKQLRAGKEGMRLYIWLYRHCPEWLSLNKPKAIKKHINIRVDWPQRDRFLVKKLLQIDLSLIYEISGPRRSKTWYAKQVKLFNSCQNKMHKLPLCRVFFDRYGETIEEYQTRRLACAMDHLIENKDHLRPACEIERDAGLSKQRSREPARKILRLDIPAWQKAKITST